jgi:hypothetical protein
LLHVQATTKNNFNWHIYCDNLGVIPHGNNFLSRYYQSGRSKHMP